MRDATGEGDALTEAMIAAARRAELEITSDGQAAGLPPFRFIPVAVEPMIQRTRPGAAQAPSIALRTEFLTVDEICLISMQGWAAQERTGPVTL